MGFWDVMSVVGAFAVIILVLFLTYYASRWYAKRMNAAPGSGKYIKFCDRASIGQNSALVIAKIGTRYYLLGISERNMQLICELPDFEPEEEGEQPPASFGRIFADLLGKGRGKPQDGGDGSDTHE